MIKTSAMFSAHAIHVLLRNTLIFLVVLFIALFGWLLAGIKLDTFTVADFNVDGLYIKLDKKLILKADNVIIPHSKEKPSFTSIPESFERVKYVLTFFDSIELKKIVFNNNTMSIDYHDDYLSLIGKDYEILGTVKREGTMIKAEIPLLRLKQHNVTMDGKFTYDLYEDRLATEGYFEVNNISGAFSAIKEESEISFEVKSNTFTDIEPLVDKFVIEEAVRSWLVEKVEAESYKLLSLSGKGFIKDQQFSMDMDTLKGEVLFSDTKIHFKENVEPVLAPSFLLTYKDYGLFFDLKAPTYKGKSLEGSKVSIINMHEDDTKLKLELKLDTTYDKTIQELLEAYELEIPVLQKNGTVSAVFYADIALKKDENSFVTDVNFSQGDVWIKNVKLPVLKGKLHYEEGFITLEDIYLKDTFYEGEVDGKIDLQKQKADLIFAAKRIELGDEKEKFFVLKDQTLPFVLKYGEDLDVDIPKLYARLTSDKNETHIYLTDLNKIKPYLTDPGPIEQGGEIDIKTKDFNTYSFNGILKRASCVLYEKKDKCKTRVAFQGKVTPENLELYAFGKSLYYNREKSRLELKNLNIDLEKFLETRNNGMNTEDKRLLLLGENSHLRYGEYSLIPDSYDIEIKENGDIKAIGSAEGDIIKFSTKKDIWSVQALRIKDKVLHPLINFDGLHDGRYTLKLSGDPKKTMKGQILVEGGVMKDFKAYNNTLAFINTIPALASLQNPGYSEKGFTIEEGVAEYRMIKSDKIAFDSIYIKGTSATIAGTGEIDLNKKTIKLDLAIQTARELGKLVGSLPLVGYIITGGDKSMTFGLQITGALDNPQVKTSAGGDILSLPLKILKRAIESPGRIINK